MSEIQWRRGQFYTFRAVRTVHLGAIDVNVNEGDEFEYDGQSLRLGGAEHNVPNLRAGIRAGWFVSDVALPMAAPAAPVAAAQQTVKPLESDERHVGFATKAARDRAMGSSASATSPAHGDATAEGVVVGRVRTATVQRTVLSDSSAVTQEINRLDNLSAPATPVRKPVATGDVQQAMAGDTLEDILPNAASTGRPQSRLAADPSPSAAERAEAARRARIASAAVPVVPENGTSDAPSDAPSDAASDLFGDLLSDASPSDAYPEALAVAQAAIPGFDWDMAAPSDARVNEALSRRDDPVFLTAVLAVETDAVRQQIAAGLRA